MRRRPGSAAPNTSRVLEQLTRTNALVVPDEAQARNLHLLDAT
ncbi:MAG: hypothetical protein ACRDMZ_08735 [Solirubrobacteraceae bacterium]